MASKAKPKRKDRTPPASPYSTGGGGTALEHRYGAVLLSYLLTEDPVPLLGDDVVLEEVHFQAASAGSPVDDFVLTGLAPDGSRRRLSLAVRRAPSFVPSDDPTVTLLADFLKVVTSHWTEVSVGQWRLGLVVSQRSRSIEEVEALCEIARAAGNASEFGPEVASPGRTTARVRARLQHLTAAITKASESLGPAGAPSTGLTWRLLSHLGVTVVHLEGTDESSRTQAVARLRSATNDGNQRAADSLFGRLVELAQRYGPTASRVTLAGLRRDLAGFPLARVTSSRRQWEILERLGERAFDRTGFRLQRATTSLELPRSTLLDELSDRLGSERTSSTIVVQGDPDVGKSSLVLRVSRRLRDLGSEVVILSLRDLPSRIAEFEAQLGSDLDSVFASAATGVGRVLVVDGAEAVLEGQDLALQDLATAALRQGFAVVAVSRSDGAKPVVETLGTACQNTGLSEPGTFDVPPLTDAEMTEVGDAFPAVSHLLTDPRTLRLLARPGLMSLLLRAGSADALRGPLSEADLFNSTWMAVVRRGGKAVPGQPSPDAREHALLALARRELGVTGHASEPDPAVLPSLRSDGLLLPVRAAWEGAPDFASDLVRDFSMARLLLLEGWEGLDAAGAPRWAIRAARVACQGRLQRAGADREQERRRLTTEFAEVADRHGARWAEVPAEALLMLADARDALAEAWPSLASARGELVTLLRLAEQRYTESGFGDTVVLAPLVELAFCGDTDLGQHDRYSRGGIGEAIRRLVLAWLNGLTKAAVGPTELRQRVRDVILEHEPEPYDDFAVTALASLGPDLDDRAEAFLLAMASDGGGHLAPAVEEIGPILAMSVTRPELLIRLAEAYYIEPPPRTRRGDRFDDWYDFREGIRSHERFRGIGARMAAWYYGPFFRLLNARPREALAFVNRMLDRAAVVDASDRKRVDESVEADALPGIDLGLGEIPPRRCIGSARTWIWYRGSSTGPYPCVSALLAVERFADQLITSLRVPIANVVELLLRDCHNLAMPGLVAGLLVRHGAFELLDGWLVRPELWHLEFNRLASEGVIHVQGPDDESVVGRERRRSTFQDAAALMTINAMAGQDRARLAQLRQIGDELVANARKMLGDSEDADTEVASVERWAAALSPESYRATASDEGLVIEFETPESVASRLQPTQAEIERSGNAIRLLNAYAGDEGRIASVDRLEEDVAIGRRLAASAESGGSFLHGADPVAAVAAAAVVAAARGSRSGASADLEWATQVLVDAALSPRLDEFSIPESVFPQGADRSAAAALPAAGLTGAVAAVANDRYRSALEACGRSLFDEVRAALVVGARIVWDAPCRAVNGTCLHEMAWQAIESGLADSRLGDWDESGRRKPEPLAGPYEETLTKVRTKDLYLNRLAHPLIAAWDASRSAACVDHEHQRSGDHPHAWPRKQCRVVGAAGSPGLPVRRGAAS